MDLFITIFASPEWASRVGSWAGKIRQCLFLALPVDIAVHLVQSPISVRVTETCGHANCSPVVVEVRVQLATGQQVLDWELLKRSIELGWGAFEKEHFQTLPTPTFHII